MKNRFCRLWNNCINKVTDIQTKDTTKTVLALIFHDNSTFRSIELFNNIKLEFDKEMTKRQSEAIAEYRDITRFFKQDDKVES